eukprot:403366438
MNNSNSHHNNNNSDTKSSVAGGFASNQSQNQQSSNNAGVELKNLKEAIIDLYLAIKIRSTEELDRIDEDHLDKEKKKLLKQDGFQILEYIRSSIEIIMNLKIEDLEKEMSMKRNHNPGESGQNSHNDMNSSGYSITSASFVHASMKEALANSQHGYNTDSLKGLGARNNNNQLQQNQSTTNAGGAVSEEPPKEYEKMLQKLESDIRGHIRLEHEMKIHLDYLEGRVEELENQNIKFEQEKKRLDKKFNTQEEKFKILTQETQDQILNITKEKLSFQEKCDNIQKQMDEQRDRYDKEIEKFKQLASVPLNHNTISINTANGLPNMNMNYSIDYSTLPSNQLSAQSNTNQSAANNGNPQNNQVNLQQQNLFNDKNIYQTISDIPFNKNQLQLLTRNNNNMIDKRNFMAVGNHSTKKRRNGSSKERQSYQGGSINGLLDYSNRQSNKNIVQNNINPYMYEMASGKKSIKKKSESIDYSKKKNKILRNSQNFIGAQGMMMPHNHNKSMIEDQKWLMTSADSDQFNTNIINSRSMFNDYPNTHNVNQTINVDRSQIHQQFLTQSTNGIANNKLHSLENLSNPAQNSRYANNHMPVGASHSFQNTKNFNTNSQIGNYKLKASLIDQSQTLTNNKQKKNSVGPSNRQSIDMNQINLNNSQVTLQRQVSGNSNGGNNRPNSQLNKSGNNFYPSTSNTSTIVHNNGQGVVVNKAQQNASNIKIKDKSSSKLRIKEELQGLMMMNAQQQQQQNNNNANSSLSQLIQAQMKTDGNNRSLSNQQRQYFQQQQQQQQQMLMINAAQFQNIQINNTRM